MISENKSVMETVMKFVQLRLRPPSFAQIANEAALDAPESCYIETINKCKARRGILVEGLRQILEVKVTLPNGVFYSIAEPPIKDTDHLAKFYVNNETVILAPASRFYCSHNRGLNQVRIAYVLNRVDLLKLALEEYSVKESFSP